MARTAISLYSVRELDEPTVDVLQRVAEAGYDGVQFASAPENVEAAKRKLDETGLDAVGAHVDIDTLEEELEEVRSLHQGALGADDAVVPWLSADHFVTVEALEHTAARMNTLAARCADAGWDLHYHNHDHEFQELANGEDAFERFLEEADAVGFEIDVGWVAYAGHDPVSMIEAYADRVELVHMKDVATDASRGDCFRELGEGDVAVQACADAARDAGASWLIYEHDDPEDPAQSIETGAEVLNSL